MTQPSSPKRPRAVAAILLALAAAAPARAQLDPLLPQAFFTAPCPNPGSAGSVVPGRDLWKIGVAPFFPDALCNDGTRAVFYVRRYADDAYSNHWHIHLQGGGNCTTAQSCADRWCSVDTNFGAKQMSTTGTPPRIRARGIFDRSSRNSFRLWNHVLVYYCSSDSWTGQASDVAVVADDPATGVSTAYRIHFRGATIVDAVRDQLRRDCGGVPCPCAAYRTVPMATATAARTSRCPTSMRPGTSSSQAARRAPAASACSPTRSERACEPRTSTARCPASARSTFVP